MRATTILWAAGIWLVFSHRGPAWAQTPDCRETAVAVRFPNGSAELDTNARAALEGTANWLKASPARTLHIQGYPDNARTSEDELPFGEQRAESVKAYLVSRGVDSTRIETATRGEAIVLHPPAPGQTVAFLACEAPPPAGASLSGPGSPLAPIPPPAAPLAQFDSPGDPRFGWAIMAGGGYEAFSSSDMRDRSSGGGAWDARLVGGLRSYGGLEAAYVGAAHPVQTLGATANTSSLIANGLEGTFRLNLPILRAASLIEPYAFLGLGWSRYSLTNYNGSAVGQSDFNSASDNVMTLPLGGGFAYGYRGLLVDVRLSYVATYLNNYLGNTNGGGTLNHFGVGGQIGWSY